MPWFLFLSLALWSAQVAMAAAPSERLAMPGELVRAHAELENDCGACHVRFKEGGQDERCRACHGAIDADLQAGTGFHGRDRAASTLECRHCHSDHRGRDARIVLFDVDSFDHRATDFPLAGAHHVVSCSACHEAGRAYREAPHACRDCHRKDDWHMGRLGDCGDCHTPVGWGAWRFDHDRTGFSLEGGHVEADCERCHANARYARTPKACNACHDLDDVHRGANGEACQDCHGQDQWRRPDFDHDRDTDYPLEGRHAMVPCAACHGDDVRAPREIACRACHEREDAHNGLYGEACQECHLSKSWVRTTFDHRRDTDYPLEGAHRALACGQCHRGSLHQSLPRDCFSCHQGDDRHGGQQGQRCGDCHGSRSWVVDVRFDHDLTDFPLLGIHRVVPCEACHLSPEFQGTPRACVRCHGRDDARAHGGRLGGDCAQCHNATDWRLWTFDHSRQTDYPLTGAHRDLDCHACHTQPVEEEVRLETDCVTCHEGDDVHEGGFGRDCGHCHVTSDWREVKSP